MSSIKKGLCIAQGIYFPTFALRFGGRWVDEKLEQLGGKKSFIFFLRKGKVFLPLHSASEEEGKVEKRKGRERKDEEKQIKNISFFICGKEKVSYLCSPKRNGS